MKKTIVALMLLVSLVTVSALSVYAGPLGGIVTPPPPAPPVVVDSLSINMFDVDFVDNK